jgi:hypothetical protein
MAKSVPLPESWLATLPTELSHRLFAKARHSRHLGNPRTMRCTRVCTEFACQIFRATARQHRRRVALGSWRSGTVRPRPSAFVVLRTARPASVNSAPSRRLAQKSRRSAANSGNRSYCPCAHRYSTAKFWPSTKPCSLRTCRKAGTKCGTFSGDRMCMKPTTGTAACCARAASGHAAERRRAGI